MTQEIDNIAYLKSCLNGDSQYFKAMANAGRRELELYADLGKIAPAIALLEDINHG